MRSKQPTRSELAEIEVEIVAETTKAWKVRTDSDHEAVWIPRSQCEVEKDEVSGIATITLPEWIAIDRGLI